MPGRAKYIRIGRIKSALRKHFAIVSRAAKQVGMTRQALAERIAASPELQAYILVIKEEPLDLAENIILTALKKGDLATAWKFLEKHGKARGYGNSTTIELSDDFIAKLVGRFAGNAVGLVGFIRTLDPPSEAE